MKSVISLGLGWILMMGLCLQAAAESRPTPKTPRPLNSGVTHEAYPNTDIALIKYKTSRREFRVGHAPYKTKRFQVAEFILLTGHLNKYGKPDYKAEIMLAPGRQQPSLLANKTFQGRWQTLIKKHQQIINTLKRVRYPKECRDAWRVLLNAWQDELFLAQRLALRLFVAQAEDARVQLCKSLRKRFQSVDAQWFDRLCQEFQQTGDLSVFYPRFVDLMIKPAYDRFDQMIQVAMKRVGLEYATAVQEKGDLLSD